MDTKRSSLEHSSVSGSSYWITVSIESMRKKNLGNMDILMINILDAFMMAMLEPFESSY